VLELKEVEHAQDIIATFSFNVTEYLSDGDNQKIQLCSAKSADYPNGLQLVMDVWMEKLCNKSRRDQSIYLRNNLFPIRINKE